MIIGVGCDVLNIGRMEGFLDKPGSDRVFTKGEREYIALRKTSASQSAAGIFAAKEAVLKALGTGIRYRLTDLEIMHEEGGRPAVKTSGALLEDFPNARYFVSISHDGDCAFACAVVED